MNKQDFEQFKSEKARITPIGIDDLTNKAPRTLLYGYDTDRATYHVYIDPQDQQIHVLHYLPTGPVDKEQVLVLSHTFGPAGGVKSNESYIPNKRLYPESCDLEFCRLLRDADVTLPFTTYNEQGLERVNRHNGFAGHIFKSDMPKAVKMEEHLPINKSEFAEAGVIDLLIRTACYATGALFRPHGYPEVILVADTDVEMIAAKIVEYHRTMGKVATEYLSDIQEAVTEKVMRWHGYGSVQNQYPGLPGAYVAEVNYADSAEFIEQPDTVEYATQEGVRALQGTYEGRPYFIILHRRMGGQFQIHLFGSSEDFIKKVIENNRLVPVVKAS